MGKSTAYRILLAFSLALNVALVWAWRRTRRQPVDTAAARRPVEPQALPSALPPHSPAGPTGMQAAPASPLPARIGDALRLRFQRLDSRLFAGALAVFLVTRLIGLDRFPIYFFTDEAAQTVLASDFVRNGLRDHTGDLFPTYFLNDQSYNLSVSVYAQVIPFLLFGQTIFVTRATSSLIALTGLIAVGLILKRAFRARFWWVGALLLSITPAWFLHSRTAFETVLATTFYAWFLYFYLRYRDGHPRALLAALPFGALSFYTYSPMQVVTVLTGLALLIVDARYHWQNRRTAAVGLAVLGVLVLPYLRFLDSHPGESLLHLRRLNSYWLRQDLSLDQKLERFGREYTYGLSPGFWYIPDNNRDLIRHKMKGYGNILPVTLPLALLGALIALRRIRSASHRTALIAAAVAPVGAALVAVHVTRALAFVIPAALLTAVGLAAVLGWLSRRIAYRWLAIGAFAILSIANLAMLYDALTNAPNWYNDYHIGGLQFGAKEVFGEMRSILERSPDTQVLLSSTWANGANVLLRFFMPDEPRAKILNIDAFAANKLELTDDMLLIMTPPEYQRALVDPKFAGIRLEQTLKYPDGSDGFYFVRLHYSPGVDAIFKAEREGQLEPVVETLALDGQEVTIAHSRFDIGRVHDLFDHDAYTLARTQAINPALVEIAFSRPRRLTGVTLTTGTKDFTVTVRLFAEEGKEPVDYTRTLHNPPPDPMIDIPFDDPPERVSKIRIEVLDLTAGDFGYVHLREITLR